MQLLYYVVFYSQNISLDFFELNNISSVYTILPLTHSPINNLYLAMAQDIHFCDSFQDKEIFFPLDAQNEKPQLIQQTLKYFWAGFSSYYVTKTKFRAVLHDIN